VVVTYDRPLSTIIGCFRRFSVSAMLSSPESECSNQIRRMRIGRYRMELAFRKIVDLPIPHTLVHGGTDGVLRHLRPCPDKEENGGANCNVRSSKTGKDKQPRAVTVDEEKSAAMNAACNSIAARVNGPVPYPLSNRSRRTYSWPE
jgi:hypothetical protein